MLAKHTFAVLMIFATVVIVETALDSLDGRGMGFGKRAVEAAAPPSGALDILDGGGFGGLKRAVEAAAPPAKALDSMDGAGFSGMDGKREAVSSSHHKRAAKSLEDYERRAVRSLQNRALNLA